MVLIVFGDSQDQIRFSVFLWITIKEVDEWAIDQKIERRALYATRRNELSTIMRSP